jgi:predicted transcriptional regulator
MKDMNQNWDKINKSLGALNKTIEDSLDALLTGINPEGLKETSKSLKEIIDTMGKSIQSMNLENVMRELRMLTGSGVKIEVQKTGAQEKSNKATPLQTGMNAPYQASNQPAANANAPAKGQEEETSEELDEATIAAYKEAYGGVLPPHLLKQKKKKESHLLKPSDFFGT